MGFKLIQSALTTSTDALYIFVTDTVDDLQNLPNINQAGSEANTRWFARAGSCARVIGAGRWYILSPSNEWKPLFYMTSEADDAIDRNLAEMREVMSIIAGYKDDAAASKTAAAKSEKNAADSKTAAKNSENNAASSASAASNSAKVASDNASAASSSATAAQKSADAAAASKKSAAASETAAASSERNAEASKNLAATSESNASASASAAAASETAAKASADKAQTLVDGIPDDYATALKDISRLKENKLDKPNNPVVGQLLRVKSISDTGEITLETVADNDDNKLPTGGSTGQVLAKSTNSDYDVGWVDQTDALPDGGASGQVLTKNSSTNGDASWKTPGVALPDGGKPGQVLTKNSSTNGDASWKTPGVALPDGGKPGQVLTKNSSTNGDASWETPDVALPDGGTSGQVLTKNSSASGDASWKTPATPSNPLPTGGTSGQVLAKSTNSDYDVGWVDQTGGSGILPSGGYPGAYLRKKSISDYDTEWVTRPFESKKVWTNTDLSSGKFLPDSLVIIGNTIEKFNRIVSDYTLCYTDAKDISASYGSEKRMYTLTIPYDFESEYTFIMQTARGYRYVSIDNEGSYGLVFSVGFNTQTNAQDNSVAIPYAIYAVVESVNRDD